MDISCVVCGRRLPDWHERTPSSVDFCSLRCAEESGATLEQIREFKRLCEAHKEGAATAGAERIPA